ncbi:MAG: hypothetical protein ACRC3Y_14820, partial [Romboutsia sp.]|uniref:hypothetical protein n=1 Tax=Romboutsia sp. TaxID=1965302 RepID=UPI003F331C7C
MKKLNQALSILKEELSGLLDVMLMSERTNSQRCIAKELDTTKTIVDHKDESEAFNQDDLNKIGKEISNLIKDIKGIVGELLISERMNSQRC